eukprot:CAMPEP_0197891282 /NCGR_PEP_ID=MMETSP1439-20131203/27888_1 /TAXON_ID=66791 /ORGANISM="Gonyaulax spinifera, Strain CCMP409" /LENGTH=219 /DNA_ID=CAMNT_0043511371 /DNA_START=79 /DNA_END=738 /DNA_ORIENTATION=-
MAVRTAMRRKSARALPALSCLALISGLALLALTLSKSLPEVDEPAFAGAARPMQAQKFLAPRRKSVTALQGVYEDQAAYMAERQKRRRRVTDRGNRDTSSDELRKAEKQAMWDAWQRTGMDTVFEQQEVVITTPPPSSGSGEGGGFSLPSFELPSFPAPAPAPAPVQREVPASAPAPASGGGGNPFAFLTELFQGTTTTTTTTPPPSPLESFLGSLGLR